MGERVLLGFRQEGDLLERGDGVRWNRAFEHYHHFEESQEIFGAQES